MFDKKRRCFFFTFLATLTLIAISEESCYDHLHRSSMQTDFCFWNNENFGRQKVQLCDTKAFKYIDTVDTVKLHCLKYAKLKVVFIVIVVVLLWFFLICLVTWLQNVLAKLFNICPFQHYLLCILLSFPKKKERTW